AVADRFGLAATSVSRWSDKPCRWLDGVTVEILMTPSPRKLCRWSEVTGYSEADLKRISKRRKQLSRRKQRLARQNRKFFQDEEGVWLTRSELADEYDVSLRFPDEWKDKPSKLRPGEMALRHKRVLNVYSHAGASKVEVYNQRDAEAILRGEESSQP